MCPGSAHPGFIRTGVGGAAAPHGTGAMEPRLTRQPPGRRPCGRLGGGGARPHSLAPPRRAAGGCRDHRRRGALARASPTSIAAASPASPATWRSSRSTAPATTTSTISRIAGRSPRTIRGSSIPRRPSTADPVWLAARSHAGPRCRPRRVVAIESIDEFNSFSPMQVIATAAETQALVKSRGAAPFLLFPEDRTRPIRMRHDLPRELDRHRTAPRSVTGKRNARRVVRLPGRRLRRAGRRSTAFAPPSPHCADPAPSRRRRSPASTSMASTGAAVPSPATSPSRRARSIPSGAACRSRRTRSPAATSGTVTVHAALRRQPPTPAHCRSRCRSHSQQSVPVALTVLPRHHRGARRQRALAPLPPPLAQLDALPG